MTGRYAGVTHIRRPRPAGGGTGGVSAPVTSGLGSLRLVGVCLVVCLAPLALLTYFTIHLADQAVVKEVNARVRTTSAVTAVLLNTQMQSIVGFASSYASRPLLIKALADGNPANFDTEVVDGQLSQLSPPGSGGAFLTDMSCRLTHVRPPAPELIGQDLTFQDWCRGMKTAKGSYVSEAHLSTMVGHPYVVSVAVMVRAGGTEKGAPLGMLGVVYPVAAVRAFADDLARAQGIRLTITDQHGTLLAGRSASDGADGLASALSDPRVSEALAGRSGVTRSVEADGDAISGFAPVAGVGWTVTAEVPARQALAGVAQLRETVLIVAGLLGLVILAAVVLLARALRQRRQAEHARHEKEANTRAILAAATDAFIAMDATGTIIAWNRQAEVVFGWTEAEALGRRLFETILPPEMREASSRGLAEFVATGKGFAVPLNVRFESFGLHRDGHRFMVELGVWPVRTSGSWVFNAFLQDITERKLAEAALATARDEALAASQLKSEFLANMSHEIRTPMNGVLGMTSLLLDTDLGVHQREFAETVQASGEALLTILNDILDFSKIEAGRLDLECIDFDLRGLVEDVAGMFSQPAHAKGLELACSVPIDMPAVVRGDPGRVRQIVTNLVGNAVKFTPSGEVVLELTMAGSDATSSAMRFQVADTGIGIAEGDQTTVFESFSQADAGTTRRYGGTGLGLAISRQLVELMGGQIGVTSEVGHGSTFWFTIPLQLAGSLAPPAPRSGLPGLRILVVDDNATNREILTRFLQSWGVRSDAADGAVAALRALAAATVGGDPFDAALLDLNMPEIDGIELGRVIASDTTLRPIKLVLLTSSGQAGEAERAREAGIASYLTKPVRQSQLHDCLATLLAAPPSAEPEVQVPSGPRAARDGTHGRILLAEDNLVNQRVASAMLVNLGFEVDIAADGAQAVAAATTTRYRAILMDCQMPVMDGFEATAQIRSLHGESSRTPIVAVTASAMKSDVQRCLDAGMDDYLSKPVRLKALAAVMARWAPDESVPVPALVGADAATPDEA